jgi:deoxyribose-phosphate aldolase
VEIDMVVNIGKVLQEKWDYLEREIRAVVDTAHRYQAITKVIFETDYVTSDEHKIRLCKICTKAGAEYVKTSTGFGFVKGPDGTFSYTGATEHDVALMRMHAGSGVKVKAAGGVRTLDDLLKLEALGISRCGATATAAILDEARRRFADTKGVVS